MIRGMATIKYPGLTDLSPRAVKILCLVALSLIFFPALDVQAKTLSSVTAKGHLYRPAGKFADLVSPGPGFTLDFGFRFKGMPADLHFETGLTTLNGRAEQVAGIWLIPFAITIAYPLQIGPLFLEPGILCGVNIVSGMYYLNESDMLLDHTSPDTSLAPLLGITCNLGYPLNRSVMIIVGGDYRIMNESGSWWHGTMFSLGARCRIGRQENMK